MNWIILIVAGLFLVYLPNIVTLNLGAVYRLNKQIHFSAQLNNLLSKRTDLFYGMPAQRFNIMAGVGVCF